MAEPRIDWPAMEATAASLVASNPLAPRIAAATPSGGHVEVALRASLADVVARATAGGPLGGPLVVAVDTLDLEAGETVVSAPALAIVARSILVDGEAEATLAIRSDLPDTAIQLTTAGIGGDLLVAFQTAAGAAVPGPGNGALSLSGHRAPQSITATPSQAAAASTDQLAIADELHQPWALVALELSGAIAARLIDDGAPSLAAEMLSWVAGGCSALLAQSSQFPSVDFASVASLQTSAIGLFAFTQAQTSGATYVPVLSAGSYQQQIEALLELAQVYDSKIAAFESEENLEQLLASFAKTLDDTCQQAQRPLLNALRRIADEAGSVQTELTNAAVQLDNISETLPALQQELVAALQEQFQQELVKAALETFATVLTLYAGAAGAVLGDPEVLAGKTSAVIKAASELATELIEAGEKIGNQISSGYDAASQPPAPDNSAAAAQGAQYLAGSMASFGSAAALLWAVIGQACRSQPPNLSPNLVAAVDKLPDLSGFSVNGLDPTAYWGAVVIQTKAAVEPHSQLPQASAYLEAVELAATYGTAVGDLQWKLLGLYTQGMAAFDQLVATSEAQASWASLHASLSSTADEAAAAVGLLQRGYLNVKRSLVLAVENYRAAFLYQWLQPSEVEIDVSMDLIALRQQATNAVAGLNEVLAGKASGPVRPRQKFNYVTCTVEQDDLFKASKDGRGEARFTIDPTALAPQLSGDTALYLTAARFQLEGGDGADEVELEIATSGHYENLLDDTPHRFVSKPVSMTNNYLPGDPPKFITQWEFADAAAYLAPTPYTNWTLTVRKGDWRHATGIKVELSGLLLQNQ